MAINVHGACKYDCKTTWNAAHGPDHSVPGTRGKPGDVRRCQHGRLWMYTHTYENRYFCMMDSWMRVSRVWNPSLYRRATKLLKESK